MASNDPAARLRKNLARNAVELAAANARVARLEERRTQLYREARERQITFREIASAYGVTEAAVMQKCKRAGIGG
jgi:DNA-directed RNA polymerase specialized sigma subunit